MKFPPSPCIAVSASLAFIASASAWTGDAANPQVLVGGSNQVQPKVKPAPGGGFYLAWFDGANGYDVRLQKFDALGAGQWGATGVLVADVNLSSTQDYGFDVAANGDVVLAYQDTSTGSARIGAQRISGADGSKLWGATGIILDAGAGMSPRAAVLSDGSAAVGWSEGTATRVQRISASGATQWIGISVAETGKTCLCSDVQAATNGDVIVSTVRYITFTGAKLLNAQKLSSTGAPLWGTTGTYLFTTGSLQFGNFPTFVHDGAGGAAFAWYTTGNPAQSWVQRLSAAGQRVFASGGVSMVATAGTTNRTAPAVAYDAATSRVYAIFTTSNSTQSLSGVGVQAFDAAGVRQWGAQGVELDPISSYTESSTRVDLVERDGVRHPDFDWLRWSSFSAVTVQGALCDASTGAPVWSADLASSPSEKGRGASCATDGGVVYAWEQGATGSTAIHAQRTNADGSLGDPPPTCLAQDLDCSGSVDGADLAALLAMWGSCAGCAGDLDGNGAVDGADLGVLLAAWD